MAGEKSCVFIFVTVVFFVTDAQPISIVPGSVLVGPGDRTMMFTGLFAKPARRSSQGKQATGVFAQGNAVSGGTFLGALQPEQNEAEPPETFDDEQNETVSDSPNFNTNKEESTTLLTVETTLPPKKKQKKNRNPPSSTVCEDEENSDEEYNDDDSVVPIRGYNRRRQGYPSFSNFFPMIFGFPGLSSRSGSSGSEGAITAIANSYSTTKGGIASSVATAYGGSPEGKKRRNTSSDE